MKNTIALLGLLCIGITALGQSRSLEKFTERYTGKHDVTHITLDGGIFKFAGWLADFGDEEDEELRALGNISDDIDRMEILSIDDFEDFFSESEVDDLIDGMKLEGYEILMTIREDGKIIRILSEEPGNSKLKNVSIIIKDRRDFSIITIDGTMNLDDLGVLMDN